jgi:hypothetical protein
MSLSLAHLWIVDPERRVLEGKIRNEADKEQAELG